MKKVRKSATKHEGRKKTDWKLFVQLCEQGKSNAEIAKRMGWATDPKSEDKFKRVRAAKSLARTRGIRLDGKLVRLHDRKLKPAENAKPAAKKKVKSKPKPKPPVAQPSSPTPAESK